MTFSIVTAVNDENILARNLLRSSIIVDGHTELHCYRGQGSMSLAYNRGIMESNGEYIIFAHQDVYLPKSWERSLHAAISQLNLSDPGWAILGMIGLSTHGEVVGRVWCSGNARVLGTPPATPERVVTIDELAFVMRRAANVVFDDGLPSFHLYGTDIVQIAAARGMNSYVANLPVVHNGRPVRGLGGGYAESYRYMRRKWRAELPLATLITPVTANPFSFPLARLRSFAHRKRRLARAFPDGSDPRDIARNLHFE